ncbi:wiskott-Aldrich syndrome protein homolog [Sapajus apella]|uniref:Wiskott-Aldrich syndrome protein homolog n=1 Tax=Sapajus apella TaxID=9515 RepID=A0A6J3FAN5_SAPAP|nr:wiskott-Aldrich syndrome protein homolog [Sapajus apella]
MQKFPKSFSSLTEIQSHLTTVELGILSVDPPREGSRRGRRIPIYSGPSRSFPGIGTASPPPADPRGPSPGIHGPHSLPSPKSGHSGSSSARGGRRERTAEAQGTSLGLPAVAERPGAGDSCKQLEPGPCPLRPAPVREGCKIPEERLEAGDGWGGE